MNGNVQQKSLSREFLTNLTLEKILEVILLIIAGSMAIVLHARLRTPINVPGHHGIEFMTIILAARLSSSMKWASSISALGIGIFILFPVLGFSDPMSGFNYMLPCFMLDFVYNVSKNTKYRKLVLTLGAGLAYMMVPLSRIIFSMTTGYIFPSFLKHGMITPMFSFFFFGLAGGALGTGIYYLIKSILKKL
mgnify:CR=1 FL=1